MNVHVPIFLNGISAETISMSETIEGQLEAVTAQFFIKHFSDESGFTLIRIDLVDVRNNFYEGNSRVDNGFDQRMNLFDSQQNIRMVEEDVAATVDFIMQVKTLNIFPDDIINLCSETIVTYQEEYVEKVQSISGLKSVQFITVVNEDVNIDDDGVATSNKSSSQENSDDTSMLGEVGGIILMVGVGCLFFVNVFAFHVYNKRRKALKPKVDEEKYFEDDDEVANIPNVSQIETKGLVLAPHGEDVDGSQDESNVDNLGCADEDVKESSSESSRLGHEGIEREAIYRGEKVIYKDASTQYEPSYESTLDTGWGIVE